MTSVQWAAIFIALCMVGISVILLSLELNDVKRTQRASISLQLHQQLRDPIIQTAMNQVRMYGASLLFTSPPNMNGSSDHTMNGKQEMNGNNRHVLRNGSREEGADTSINETLHAMSEVHHFFAHVGHLLHRGDTDSEVFRLMGPAISEMWHILRLQTISDATEQEHRDFEWLYTEWLNWDYGRRDSWSAKTARMPAVDRSVKIVQAERQTSAAH
jgi:hypothetical protein